MIDNSLLLELCRLYEKYHILPYYGVPFNEFVNDVSTCVPIKELRHGHINIEERVLEVERRYLKR